MKLLELGDLDVSPNLGVARVDDFLHFLSEVEAVVAVLLNALDEPGHVVVRLALDAFGNLPELQTVLLAC
jgi:hypothetical protein